MIIRISLALLLVTIGMILFYAIGVAVLSLWWIFLAMPLICLGTFFVLKEIWPDESDF